MGSRGSYSPDRGDGACAVQDPGAGVPIHLHSGVVWDPRVSVSSCTLELVSPPTCPLGLCRTLGLGVPPCTPGLRGPYQGILVDIGPLNLLGSVPSQNHGSAQHIQVLLQGHGTGERTMWEPDVSLLQPGDTLVPVHTPGILMG